MKVYLDIDGVLLTKDKKVPDYGDELIDFLTDRFDCYWLTTHSRTESNVAVEYLKMFYKSSTLEKLKKIKSSDWKDLKTEGIDYKSDFIWLEDYPFNSEKEELRKRGKLDSLIIVDLTRQNELKNIENKIKNKLDDKLHR